MLEVACQETVAALNGGSRCIELCVGDATSVDEGEIGTCRMSSLSTGDQDAGKSAMLTALLQAAYTHLRGSLPVKYMQIVLQPQTLGLNSLLVEAGQALEPVRSRQPDIRVFLDERSLDEVAGDVLREVLPCGAT
jgi:hypothetical protein